MWKRILLVVLMTACLANLVEAFQPIWNGTLLNFHTYIDFNATLDRVSRTYRYDDYMFLSALNDAAVTIFDISTRGRPYYVNTLDQKTANPCSLEGPRGVAMDDRGYVYVCASTDDSISVYNLTNIYSETCITNYTYSAGNESVDNCWDVDVVKKNNGYYVFTDSYGTDNFLILNVTNVSEVTRVTNFTASSGNCTVDGATNIVYNEDVTMVFVTSAGDNAITTLNITDFARITCLNTYTDVTSPYSVEQNSQDRSNSFYRNGTLYVGSFIDNETTAFNVTTFGTLVPLGSFINVSYNLSGSMARVSSIYVDENKIAYITSGGNSFPELSQIPHSQLTIVNFSNPYNPTFIMNITPYINWFFGSSQRCSGNGSRDALIVDNYVYFTSWIDHCMYTIKMYDDLDIDRNQGLETVVGIGSQNLESYFSFDNYLFSDVNTFNTKNYPNNSNAKIANPGKINSGLWFDGTDDLVNYTSIMPNRPYTIAWWGKAQDTANVGYWWGDSLNNGSAYTYGRLNPCIGSVNCLFDGGIENAWLYNGWGDMQPTPFRANLSVLGLNATNWTFYTQGANTTGYVRWSINNVSYRNASTLNGTAVPRGTFIIGNRADWARDLLGWIDEFMIFNDTLSPYNLSTLYNDQVLDIRPFTTLSTPKNLSVLGLTSTSIAINWTNPTEKSWNRTRVFYNSTLNSTLTLVSDESGTGKNITGLTAGIIYYVYLYSIADNNKNTTVGAWLTNKTTIAISDINITYDGTNNSDSNWSAEIQGNGILRNYTFFQNVDHFKYIVVPFDTKCNETNGIQIDVSPNQYTASMNNPSSSMWLADAGEQHYGVYQHNSTTVGSYNLSWTGNVLNTTFYIRMVIKIEQHTLGDNGVLLSKWETTNNKRSWALWYTPVGNLTFTTSDDGVKSFTNGAGFNVSPYLGKWIDLVAVYNETHNKLYINGSLKTSKLRVTNGTYPSTQPIIIGGSTAAGAWTNGVNGSIDLIEMGNWTPTDMQISEWYDSMIDIRQPRLMADEVVDNSVWTATGVAADDITGYVTFNKTFVTGASALPTNYTNYIPYFNDFETADMTQWKIADSVYSCSASGAPTNNMNWTMKDVNASFYTSATKALYVNDTNAPHSQYVDTPVFILNGSNISIRFSLRFRTELNYDGLQLKYKINETGAWLNITNSSSDIKFTLGQAPYSTYLGYGGKGTSTTACYQNAFSLADSGMIYVNLSGDAHYGNLSLRFHTYSDTNTVCPVTAWCGYYVDDFNITYVYPSGGAADPCACPAGARWDITTTCDLTTTCDTRPNIVSISSTGHLNIKSGALLTTKGINVSAIGGGLNISQTGALNVSG